MDTTLTQLVQEIIDLNVTVARQRQEMDQLRAALKAAEAKTPEKDNASS